MLWRSSNFSSWCWVDAIITVETMYSAARAEDSDLHLHMLDLVDGAVF